MGKPVLPLGEPVPAPAVGVFGGNRRLLPHQQRVRILNWLSCSVSGDQFPLNRWFQGREAEQSSPRLQTLRPSQQCHLQTAELADQVWLAFRAAATLNNCETKTGWARNLVHWLKKPFGRCEVTLVSVPCCSGCDQRGDQRLVKRGGALSGESLLWGSFFSFQAC